MIIQRVPKSLDVQQLANYLLKEFSIMSIAETAAHFLKQSYDIEKVTLTEEQFRQFFKVRGWQMDGTTENRGRKPLSERLIRAKAIREAAADEERIESDNLFNSTKKLGE